MTLGITAFAGGIEAGLNAIQTDFLAANPTLCDDIVGQEDCQILAVTYCLIKALKARQDNAPGNARERVFGRVGGHSQYALYRLAEMADLVYKEFKAFAGDVDDDDSPWAADTCERGTGPLGGPVT